VNKEASIAWHWVIRMLIAGLAFFIFGLVSVYDGYIHYPKRNKIIETYREYEDNDKLDEWREKAVRKGWPKKPDVDDYKGVWDIRTQYGMAAICLPLGLLILLKLGIKSRRSLKADDQAFYSEKGVRIPYSSIIRIDKRKWREKQIADVIYRKDAIESKARIDGWIFNGGKAVLEEVENGAGLTEEEDDSSKNSSD